MTTPEGNPVETALSCSERRAVLEFLDTVLEAGRALKAKIGNCNRDSNSLGGTTPAFPPVF